MAFTSVTNTFVNGQSADATEVNTNFTDIINGLSDGTKDANMAAGTFAGAVTCNGNVTLGNGTGDDITITGSLAATLNIKTDGSYDLGSTTKGLRLAYFGDAGGNTVGIQAPAIASNYTLTLPAYTVVMPAADGANRDYLQSDGSGTMSFVGGPGITTKDDTYTATTADKIISVDTNTNGAWTLTLYAASGNAGRTIRIFKTTSDTNALTIDGNGSETIDGSTTYTLDIQYESVELVCDGSNWNVVHARIPEQNQKIIMNTSNGYGSTNTYIRRWTNIEENSGDTHLCTITQSSTDGDKFTLNYDCEVTIVSQDGSSGNTTVGISLNSSQLTTSILSITIADRLAISGVGDANRTYCTNWTGTLSANDVLRFHNAGGDLGTASRAKGVLHIRRLKS